MKEWTPLYLSTALLLSALLHATVIGSALLFAQPKALTAAGTMPTVSVSLIPAHTVNEPTNTPPQPLTEPAVVQPQLPVAQPVKSTVQRSTSQRSTAPQPTAQLHTPQTTATTTVTTTENPVAEPTAPAQPITGEPLEVISEAHVNADYLHNPKPQYPLLSRRLGEQGRVLLHVQVSTTGTPLEVTVKKSSGFTRLDEAAVTVVKQWQFVPAKRGVIPLASWVDVPLQFSLETR